MWLLRNGGYLYQSPCSLICSIMEVIASTIETFVAPGACRKACADKVLGCSFTVHPSNLRCWIPDGVGEFAWIACVDHDDGS